LAYEGKKHEGKRRKKKEEQKGGKKRRGKRRQKRSTVERILQRGPVSEVEDGGKKLANRQQTQRHMLE
jgi:hypothetical protein